MRKTKICASFVDAIKGGSGRTVYEIFKNPTNLEMRILKRLKQKVRFIIVPNDKLVYIFSGKLLHIFVMKKLSLKEYFILGYGDFIGDKIEMHHVDYSVFDLDLRWLDPWFTTNRESDKNEWRMET